MFKTIKHFFTHRDTVVDNTAFEAWAICAITVAAGLMVFFMFVTAFSPK
jgi:hypothetical protein